MLQFRLNQRIHLLPEAVVNDIFWKILKPQMSQRVGLVGECRNGVAKGFYNTNQESFIPGAVYQAFTTCRRDEIGLYDELQLIK